MPVSPEVILQPSKTASSVAPSLQSLYFYLTSYCNSNCSHCWIAPTYLNKVEAPQEAPLSLLKDAIDQALPLGLSHVKFSGGEPFLSKNLFGLISYAALKNLRITLETNGTLIDDEKAAFLKKNSVRQVAVSLDGPREEIHEALRGVSGCFQNTITGIKFLKKNGLNVQVILSLYEGNQEYLEETVSLAESYGANSFKINCISQISRGESLKAKGEVLTVADYLFLNKKIEGEIQPRHKIKIIFDIPPVFKKLRVLRNQRGTCKIKHILGIMPDGNISICGIGESVSALKLGDIRKDSLRDIWDNNGVLKTIREEIPGRLKGICGKCIFKTFCLGKCRAEVYYRNSNFLDPYLFCEEAWQLGLFPQQRIL